MGPSRPSSQKWSPCEPENHARALPDVYQSPWPDLPALQFEHNPKCGPRLLHRGEADQKGKGKIARRTHDSAATGAFLMEKVTSIDRGVSSRTLLRAVL